MAFQINPAHSGAQMDPALTLPLTVAWTAQFDSPFWYPLIAEGKVFILTQTVGTTSTLEALDAATGNVVWGPVLLPGEGSFPVYDQGRIFVGTLPAAPPEMTAQVVALDAASGELLWQTDTGEPFFIGEAAIAGTLYVTTSANEAIGVNSGFLEALNEQNGLPYYDVAVPEVGIPSLDNGGVFFGSTVLSAMTRVDARSGQITWQYPGPFADFGDTSPMVVIGNGVARLTSYGDNPVLLFDEGTGRLSGIGSENDAPVVAGGWSWDIEVGLTARRESNPTPVWNTPAFASADILVVNGIVFTTVSDPATMLVALDGQTGNQLWAGEIDGFIDTLPDAPPYSTLAAGDGIVVVPLSQSLVAFAAADAGTGGTDGGSEAPDAGNGDGGIPWPDGGTVGDGGPGAVAFQADPAHSGVLQDPQLTAPLSLAWSIPCYDALATPVIAQGFLFVGCAGQLTSYVASTGAVAWGPVESGENTSLAWDNGVLFASGDPGFLQAFNPWTGQVLWVDQLGDLGASPLVASNGVLVTTCITSGAQSARLCAVSEATGAPLWEIQPSVPDTALVPNNAFSPAIAGESVFVSSSDCVGQLDLRTGAAGWTAGSCSASTALAVTPVVAGGNVYVHGLGSSYDAITGAAVAPLAATEVPAVGGSQVFALNNGTLGSFDLTGNPGWTFVGDGSLITAPLVVNDTLYIGSTQGNLYGLDVASGSITWSVFADRVMEGSSDGSFPLAGFAAGDGVLVVPSAHTGFFIYSSSP